MCDESIGSCVCFHIGAIAPSREEGWSIIRRNYWAQFNLVGYDTRLGGRMYATSMSLQTLLMEIAN